MVPGRPPRGGGRTARWRRLASAAGRPADVARARYAPLVDALPPPAPDRDRDPGAEADADAEDDVEGWVIEAIEALPEAFRERLGSVAIVVEEEPSPAQLASVGARGLFGLYQGVPRSVPGSDWAPAPAKITIFRGPLTRAHGTPGTRRRAVGATVRHEIAHHFGISDARIHELEAAARGPSPARDAD